MKSPEMDYLDRLSVENHERRDAAYRKASRIPKYRREERLALFDEADARFAADCEEHRRLTTHYAQTGTLPTEILKAVTS